MLEGETIYTVIVEFDGKTDGAKSLYYRRLHALGLYVRGGSKDKGVLERRQSYDDRIVVQESTVTCASESLARYIVHTAYECGAAAAYIQTGPIVTNLTKTRRDAEIINRIEAKAARRGRKPVPEDWVCTCLECLTQTEQKVPYVVNCSNCGGLLIHTRKGHVRPLADPGGDVLEAWYALRFAGGAWEPCPVDDNAPLPVAAATIYNAREDRVVKSIAASPHLDVLRAMNRENAFAFLDAILVAHAYDSPERRAERRVKVITEFMMKGGDATNISFVEPTHPDLIDAAALGVGKVVGWLLRGR